MATWLVRSTLGSNADFTFYLYLFSCITFATSETKRFNLLYSFCLNSYFTLLVVVSSTPTIVWNDFFLFFVYLITVSICINSKKNLPERLLL